MFSLWGPTNLPIRTRILDIANLVWTFCPHWVYLNHTHTRRPQKHKFWACHYLRRIHLWYCLQVDSTLQFNNGHNCYSKAAPQTLFILGLFILTVCPTMKSPKLVCVIYISAYSFSRHGINNI